MIAIAKALHVRPAKLLSTLSLAGAKAIVDEVARFAYCHKGGNLCLWR